MLLAGGGQDGTVRVWDAKNPKRLRTSSGVAPVRAVAWSPDGTFLASGGKFGFVRIMQVRNGKLPRMLEEGYLFSVNSLAWSPDGRQVVGGGWGLPYDQIARWDVGTGRLLHGTMGWEYSDVSSVAVSPNGKWLAGASDREVKIWEAVSGQFLRKLFADEINSVSWSPDSKRLAGGTKNGTIRVWEAANGQVLGSFSSHLGKGFSVPGSPDGRRLASGSEDGTIKVWEAESGHLLQTLSGHSSSVLSVAWSPDTKQLASGSEDGTLGVWDMSSGENEERRVFFVANTVDPREQFLFHPTKLLYVPGEMENPNIEIEFGEQWVTRYRLSDFREVLRVADIGESLTRPDPLIRPRVLSESVAVILNNWKSVGMLALVYFAALGGVIVGRRPLSPTRLARRFFAEAGYTASKPLNAHTEAFAGTEPAYATAWPQPEERLVETIARHRKGETGRFRTYLVYRDAVPAADVVLRLGNRLRCSVIPLAATAMERSLADCKTKETLREIEEPYVTRTDPYFESKAITDPTWFFGRTKLLNDIPIMLRQGQNVGVFGLRKSGKTSLLNQVRLRLIDVPVAYLDCQAYVPVAVDLLREILYRLLAETERLVGRKLPVAKRTETLNELRAQLVVLHEKLTEKTSERFVIILDEIDKWFPNRRDPDSAVTLKESITLFRILRALAQERRMLSILIAAYRPEINRQNLLLEPVTENPMYGSFHETFLGFLGEDDTRRMIVDLGTLKEIVWSEDALKAVYRASGGHPMFSRLLASEACLEGTRKQVAFGDVRRVLDGICGNFRKHRIGNDIEESLWGVLRNDEREALQWAASEGRGEEPKGLHAALVSVEHFGLLRRESSLVSVNGELLQAWLRR